MPELLLSALVLAAYVLFSALFGLFLGVKMPNLSWTSEITPIKQSAPVTFALLSGFADTALLCLGFMLLGGWRLGLAGYMAAAAALTLALCALLYRWLRTKGCARFASL